MALEVRDIRPYKNLEGIQELFQDVELNTGQVRERGYGTLDLTEADYKEAEIKLIAGKEIVSLPMHPNLTDSDVSKVIKFTNKFN